MRNLLIPIFSCFILTTANAQYIHLSVFGGISNYQGDLQDKKFTFQQSHGAYGLGISYEASDKLFVRLNFTKGKISADDKLATKNKIRNLNFTSSLTDINLGVEYYLKNLYDYKVAPYLFAGVSYFHFDPYTTQRNSDEKIYLQPLGTEGQGFYLNRKKYKLDQLAIPFGGGIKYAINDDVRLGAEIGLRKLFTDYLDDVSTTYVKNQALLASNNGTLSQQLNFRGDELNPPRPFPATDLVRGNPGSKDWYYFAVITLSTRISAKFGSGGKNKQTGCPRL